MKRTIETKGENLLSGLKNMLDDISKGQVTQSPEGAFELGRNLATTPGKVIYETKLFQLIQYAPTTDEVLETPLVIFPPWINRFYILDLTPEEELRPMVRRAGRDPVHGQLEIGRREHSRHRRWTIMSRRRKRRSTPSATCSASSRSIPSAIAWRGRRWRRRSPISPPRTKADKVASVTFLTAQVDFEDPGDLKMFVGDDVMAMLKQLTAETGVLDGRVMAATFNLLRGRDLIWNYVVNNYLLGKEPAPFDLLHWNGDVTNLPGEWHRDYLDRLYRQNLMIKPGGMSVKGVPIDLSKIETPAYIQAGREDHIAPGAERVEADQDPQAARSASCWPGQAISPGWSTRRPPTNINIGPATSRPRPCRNSSPIRPSIKGSWWPDWIQWLKGLAGKTVKADGARIPGEGKLKPIEDAPGRYVRTR